MIWSEKILKPHLQPHAPSHKQCNTPHCQCPYTRPQPTKPSNAQFSPISVPLPQAKLCLNKLLAHLVSLNDTSQIITEDHSTTPLDPCSPTTTRSTQSSSSPSTSDSECDAESTSSYSTLSTASDRQLCPRIPISYNETFLKKLHGRPQVRVMHNLSILLLASDSDAGEDMDTTYALSLLVS